MHCNATTDDCQLRWLRNEPHIVVFKLATFVQYKAARSTSDIAPHAGFTLPLLCTSGTANFLIKISGLPLEITRLCGLQVNSKCEAIKEI
jgi:hypothetical protein